MHEQLKDFNSQPHACKANCAKPCAGNDVLIGYSRLHQVLGQSYFHSYVSFCIIN